MQSAGRPTNEKERLEALNKLNILDTPSEREFDDVTLIASQICGTPIALISLIDDKRQWFKSKLGLTESETSRDVAFCAHAILDNELFVVPDARLDERFRDNPLVTSGPGVAFYAGAPLTSPDGYQIGTLCVIDRKERNLTTTQKTALSALANQVNRLLELRLELRESKAHREQLEFKRTALENLSEGVILHDDRAVIIDFNKAALELLGMTPQQLMRETSPDDHWQLLRDDGTPLPDDEHPAAFALKTGKKIRNVKLGVRSQSTGIRWLSVNATPLFLYGSKVPYQAVSSFSDVTAIVQSTELLARAKSDLARILNGVPALIAHWSAELKNLNSNTAYDDFFGFSASRIRGRTLLEIFGADIYQRNIAGLQRVLGGETLTFERVLKTKTGESKVFLGTYLPVLEGGVVAGFYTFLTDITELKRLEKEREALAAKVMESSKFAMLGEMAGGIAHEINTPLAVIHAKADLLSQAFQEGEVATSHAVEQLEKIKLTADRIAKIIKGLRQFSRNSSGDIFEQIRVLNLIEATVDLCRDSIKKNDIKLMLDLDLDNEAYISGRFAELLQVIMNLLSNSVDATSELPEKWIHVRSFVREQKLLISLTDSGFGIPQDIAEKIMNPFFTTKAINRGTGLGLSISKRIVEAHFGSLQYSVENGHTTFTIKLPLAAPVRNEDAV